MKVVDIDQFLSERAFKIKINGKEFTVKDLDPQVMKDLRENQDEKQAIQEILGCEKKDLDGYGLATFNHILNQVTENLLKEPSQKET